MPDSRTEAWPPSEPKAKAESQRGAWPKIERVLVFVLAVLAGAYLGALPLLTYRFGTHANT